MKGIKCVLVGDAEVGKTSLLTAYAQNKFPQDYVPTVFDCKPVTVNVGDEPYKLATFHVSGLEDRDTLRPLTIDPETDIFLVCYSVVMPASFENVKEKWIPEIARLAPGVPYILVGTQTDLRDDEETNRRLADIGQRVITASVGQRLANETKSLLYVECSALTQFGIENVFDKAILAALEKRNEPSHNSWKKPSCGLM